MLVFALLIKLGQVFMFSAQLLLARDIIVMMMKKKELENKLEEKTKEVKELEAQKAEVEAARAQLERIYNKDEE